MNRTAIIGGTGLNQLKQLTIHRREKVETPYGSPSSELVFGEYQGREYVFLARHGEPHTIPPHRINYRANIQALKQVGVTRILAVAAVGGIHALAEPGKIVIPDQLIDYTYGRTNSFYDEPGEVIHIDFTHPYSKTLREKVLNAARLAGVDCVAGGVYGCTQGPRLETPAEIARMERDGCTLVGMTGMPEAALAREVGLDYVCCAIVANWAAGKSAAEEITLEEIHAHITTGLGDFVHILKAYSRQDP